MCLFHHFKLLAFPLFFSYEHTHTEQTIITTQKIRRLTITTSTIITTESQECQWSIHRQRARLRVPRADVIACHREVKMFMAQQTCTHTRTHAHAWVPGEQTPASEGEARKAARFPGPQPSVLFTGSHCHLSILDHPQLSSWTPRSLPSKHSPCLQAKCVLTNAASPPSSRTRTWSAKG